MELIINEVVYKDAKELSKELEFSVASERVRGSELLIFKLKNLVALVRFRNSVSKILRSMKKDGIIKLYLLGNELCESEKMESIYLLNKFPELNDLNLGEGTVILKL